MRVHHFLLTTLGLAAMTVFFGCSRESSVKENVNLRNNHSRVFAFKEPILNPQAFADSMANVPVNEADSIPDTLTVTVNDTVYLIGLLPYNVDKIYRFQWVLAQANGTDTTIVTHNATPQAWTFTKDSLYYPLFVAFDGNNTTDTAGSATKKTYIRVIDTKPKLIVPKDTVWTSNKGNITFPIVASDSFGSIQSIKIDLDAGGAKDSAKVWETKTPESKDSLDYYYLTIKNDTTRIDSLGNQKIYVIITDDDGNETKDSVNLHFNRIPRLKVIYPQDGARHNSAERFYFYYEGEDKDNPQDLKYFIRAQESKNGQPPQKAFTENDLIASNFTSVIFEPTDSEGKNIITRLKDNQKLTGRIYWDMYVTDGYDTVDLERKQTGTGSSRPWTFYIGDLSATYGTFTGTAKYQGRSNHAGIKVEYTNGNKTFDATTDDNGNYTVNVDAGAYTATARPNIREYSTAIYNDLYIETGSTIILDPMVLKDTAKPMLEITNKDTLVNTRSYTQTVYARDIGSRLDSVKATIDGTIINFPTSCKLQEENSVFYCTFSTDDLSDGKHNLVYTAKDNAGNIDTLKQAITVMATKVDIYVNDSKNARIGETGTSKLVFTATIKDAIPAPQKIDWFWESDTGKTTKTTTVEDGKATFSYTYTELKDIATAGKEYVMTASYTENGANATAQVKFGLLGENPTVIFTEPAFDTTVSINDIVHLKIETFNGNGSNSLTVNWTCEGSTKISSGSCPTATNATSADLAYSTAGTYTITVTVTDDNSKTSSGSIKLIVVNDPPTIDVTTKNNSNEYKINSTVTVYASASDKFGTIKEIKWGCSNGNVTFDQSKPYESPVKIVTEEQLNITLPGSEVQNHRCVFQAIDDDNQSSNDTLTFTTTLDPPTVNLATKRDTVKINSYQKIKAIAKDKLGKITKYEIDCKDKLADINTSSMQDMNGKDTITIRMPMTATDKYYCVVQVTDDDNNKARDTAQYKVIVGLPTVTAAVNYSRVSIKDTVELNAHAHDSIGSIVKYEWGCGPATATSIGYTYSSKTTPKTTMAMPSTAQNGYQCVVRVTDDDNNTAKDTVKIDVVLAPPSIQITNKNITVREGYNIALNATAYDNNNNLPSDPGGIVKREWSCASPSKIEQNWKTVSVFDTVWKAPAPQSFICVARATDNDGNSVTDTVSIKFSTEIPLITVRDELIYVKAGDGFELDASVNNVWQGIDWFKWECKFQDGSYVNAKLDTLKYDYALNHGSFTIGKDGSYSSNGKDMNCTVSAQETSTKQVFSATTAVKLMKNTPVGVITAADTVYLWSGDESVDDEAVYFYSSEWGGAHSIKGDLGNDNMRDYWWRFDNVDANYYQGKKNGSLDTSIAEFNTAFIRKTREGSMTIYLDFRDSTATTATQEFYNRHRAAETSHKVYFAKAWRNQGKDTVIAKTSSTIAPSLAIVNNVPMIAYAESESKVVISRLNSGSWSSPGSIAASTVKKISTVALGSDFYFGIIDNSGLTVYKSTGGTSAPSKIGSSSGIKDVKLISNGSNTYAVVINSNSKIEMYNINASSVSKNTNFGTIDNSNNYSNFDATFNSDGSLVVVGVTSGYKLYYGYFSKTNFSAITPWKEYASEIGQAKLASSGSKIYMVYYSRATSSQGTFISTGTISSSNISWSKGPVITDGMTAYDISVAVKGDVVYTAFYVKARAPQIDVYRYEGNKWHLHGENQLPYFETVFYNRNKYYLRGQAPNLVFDGGGKLYLSMLAQESSTGSKNNNGPLVMKYVADNWTIKDWK